jgi:N6-L-threonylcarbamoyladenine synthase
MEGFDRIRLLGATRDDAVGEAFDKVAKLLGLRFPGGPEIERVAKEGNRSAHRFSVPKMKSGALFDFSFSGIKTAVLYKVKELEGGRNGQTETRRLDPRSVADLAASFQASVIEEIVMKSIAAARMHRIPRLVVGGGVIANGALRERLASVCGDLKIQVTVPPLSLCTDNGAMVAGLGAHLTPRPMGELSVVPDLKVEMN